MDFQKLLAEFLTATTNLKPELDKIVAEVVKIEGIASVELLKVENLVKAEAIKLEGEALAKYAELLKNPAVVALLTELAKLEGSVVVAANHKASEVIAAHPVEKLAE